jgi:3-hydroxyacyl-[acyl-carrier-protein] dehydratase
MLTADQVLELLPQKRPFRFVDRLIKLDENGAVGEYTFRADENFYPGHFPGNPVTPGVILTEAMCQTGIVALGIYLLGLEHPIEVVRRTVTLLTETNVEFDRMVKPGDTVRTTAEKIFWRRRKLKASVVMTAADGTQIARGTVAGMGVEQ